MAWMTVLGIPAAVYVMSMVAMMFQMNEKPQNVLLLVGSGLLAVGVYMFHRSSAITADRMQPRHRLACTHKKLLLTLSFVALFASIVLFVFQRPMATLLVFGSLVGVIVYGKKTITKPLRTIVYLKPLEVGGAIALFAWVLAGPAHSIVPLIVLVLICSADALVCDLVDREYDLATGCTTLAVKLGLPWIWVAAAIFYAIAAVVLQTSVGWIFLILFPLPMFLHYGVVRTIVDIRPVLVLLLAWTV